jgi:WD40 repeat protein
MVWMLTSAALMADDKPPSKPGDPAVKAPVSFHKEIKPLLQKRCSGCHQPAKQGGKLDLTTFESFQSGGRKGATFVAGKPQESLFLQLITGELKPQMPKGDPPLPPDEVALLERWVAEGAKDDTPPTAKLIFHSDKPPVYSVPPAVSALAYSPDGSVLAVAGYHEVTLHKPDGSERLARLVGLSDRLETLVFSPDGKILAAVGGSPGRLGEVQLWDPVEKKLLRSVSVSFDNAYGASFSDDGKLLAFGCTDKSAQILSVEEGKVIRRIDQHEDWVFGTGFSKDRKHLITCSRDRTMKLIESDTGSFVDNLTSITPGVLGGSLYALARHPAEDKFLTGGEDGIPKLYKIVRTAARQIGDDNNLLMAYDRVPGVITCLAITSDGKRFAAGSVHGDLRIHELDSGKRIAEAKAPCAFYTVKFHPGGGQVAGGGFDGKVRIYDAATGSLLKEFVPVPLGTSPTREAVRSF